MKLSIRGKHGRNDSKKYRQTYRRNNTRNKRTHYVSQGGSAIPIFPPKAECGISTYTIQCKLSYKKKGKMRQATSMFNITLEKLKPPEKSEPPEKPNTLNFKLIMERISKTTEVDKRFTVYFIATYVKTSPFLCNNCYQISYTQIKDSERNELFTVITDPADISIVDLILTETNDIIDDKPVHTYKFKRDDSNNKIFFVSLVNLMIRCIQHKVANKQRQQNEEINRSYNNPQYD